MHCRVSTSSPLSSLVARSTGIILAAGGIAAANETIFAPVNSKTPADIVDAFNWRLIPATLILAAVMAGFEQVAPQFAIGLSGLVLLAVLVVPVGNAPTPLQNVATTIGA